MDETKLTFDQIRECEKNILEVFADYCEKYNLTYYLTDGTLLGAIRHNGFIPWDDDIDVVMPRPSYNRLMELLSSSGNVISGSIQLRTPYSRGYQYPFCKAVDTSTFVHEPKIKKKYDTSVWIDIFPIDGLPSDEKEPAAFIHKIRMMRKYYFYTIERRFSGTSISGWIKFNLIKLLLTIPFTISKMQQIIDKEAQKYPFNKADKIAVIIASTSYDSTIPAIWLEPATTAFFEGRTYPVIKEYDSFLRQIYHGDYMQLPPPEKRVYTHDFDAYRI